MRKIAIEEIINYEELATINEFQKFFTPLEVVKKRGQVYLEWRAAESLLDEIYTEKTYRALREKIAELEKECERHMLSPNNIIDIFDDGRAFYLPIQNNQHATNLKRQLPYLLKFKEPGTYMLETTPKLKKIKPLDNSINLSPTITRLKTGETFHLNQTGTIGRAPHNDIVIKDNPSISLEHVFYQLLDDGLFLKDLDSKNGTRVNNKPIRSHKLTEPRFSLADEVFQKN
ncbi:MAG: FHA domain-containing protein [Lactobacillales bacterium]|jgi:hypothetical protein|nr:FHA domain-containing protein [Lactobacillales bacterium]